MASYAVIMAGGSGTRLWPLSREKFPKFLLRPTGEKSLLELTLHRVRSVVSTRNIRIVCGKSHVKSILQMIPQLSQRQLFVEPFRRNTAPCIGLAAVRLIREDPEALLIVLPADHFIQNKEGGWRSSLRGAIALASKENVIVTIGITPTFPHTGYGYIEKIPGTKNCRFVEKPSLAKAKVYLRSGRHYWNAGIFVGKASVFLEEMKNHMPTIYRALEKLKTLSLDRWSSQLPHLYQQMEAVSIDYGIMEKTNRLRLVPGKFNWKDVGDLVEWGMVSLSNHAPTGHAIHLQGNGHIVYSSDKKKMIATLGIKDLLIVDTPDALLIAPKKLAQKIRQIPHELRQRGLEEYV